MTKELTVKELLAKAEKPTKITVTYHSFCKEKTQVIPKCAIRGPRDFAMHAHA